MIKTLWSFVLIALLFLATLGVILFRLTTPEFLSKQLKEVNFYGRLSDNLELILPETIESGIPLKGEDLADVIRAGVSSETFYGFTDSYLTEYLGYIRNPNESFSFSYSLEAVKLNMRDKAIDRVMAKYSELPTCTTKQASTWRFDEGLPPCQLPEGNIRSNDVRNLATIQIDTVISELPAEITQTSSPGMEQSRKNILQVFKAIYAIWIATAILTILFLLVYRRRGLWGLAITFLAVGVIEAIFGLIAWDWVGRQVIDFIPEGQAQTLPILISVITTILDVLKRALANVSMAFLILGGLFIILAIFYRPKKGMLSS